jgi:hypothetical protein
LDVLEHSGLLVHNITTYYMRFEVLKAVDIHVIVFWVMTLCILVGEYHHIEDHTATNFSIQVRLVWKWRGYIENVSGMCHE